VESIRFDMQALEPPEIRGEEYQNGTLAGCELWEYLLERDGRACVYCDAEGVPLEKEHVRPRSKGGSKRVANLACSCRPCNERKGTRSIEDFLAEDGPRLARITARLKRPLTDAAAVNSTRKALFHRLSADGFATGGWSGGRTKWNRTRLGVAKAHSLDAACVGPLDALRGWNMAVLRVACTGRGRYKRTGTDDSGFPRGAPYPGTKLVHGFQTGDLVRADVRTGKKLGIYRGRLAVRSTGSFNITGHEKVQGISWKWCRLLQRADGYGYTVVSLASTIRTKGGTAAKQHDTSRIGEKKHARKARTPR
jgi:HNH endonuclease